MRVKTLPIDRTGVGILVLTSFIAANILCPPLGGPPDAVCCEAVTAQEWSALWYNLTLYEGGSTHLALLSNGSAVLNYISNPRIVSMENITMTISSEMLDDLFLAIESEGFESLAGRYTDYEATTTAEYWSREVPFSELTLGAGDASKAIVFEGESMKGVMPSSWVALNEVISAVYSQREELLDYSLDISVSVSALNSTLVVSGTLSYDGETSLTGANDGAVWDVEIVRSNGCLFKRFPGSTAPDAWYTIDPGSQVDLEEFEWNTSAVPSGEYVIIASIPTHEGGLCGWTTFDIESSSNASNLPPIAIVSEPDGQVSQNSSVMLDASSCADREDIVTDLVVRWDFNADGTWDTDWTDDKIIEHAFSESGEVEIICEVKDTAGQTSSAVAVLLVSESDDSMLSGGQITMVVLTGIVVAVVMILWFARYRGNGP